MTTNKFVCVRNYSTGLSEYRTLVFKKGCSYEIELGRFSHQVMNHDGHRFPISESLLMDHFVPYEAFMDLREVEYMINEIGELMDDLEHNRITAKEFKELFVGCKGSQVCHALIKARKYIRK